CPSFLRAGRDAGGTRRTPRLQKTFPFDSDADHGLERWGRSPSARRMIRVMLEADLQNLAVVTDEPAIMWVRKTDGPEAADIWQQIPSAALIGSPRSFSGCEVWFGLGGNYHCVVVFVTALVPTEAYPSKLIVTVAADVGETENRSLHGRLVRKR